MLWGSGGEAPSSWAIFRNFMNKKAVLSPLDHVSHVFRAIRKPIEKIKLFSPFFCLLFKSKTRLKYCILGLNFVSDSAQVGESKVHCLMQYFSCK